jgi:hypothetical protein
MACECPTKLYYTEKKEYKDNRIDDPFLEGLRDGGFQVGELARQYYGKGTLIDTLDEAKALLDYCELDMYCFSQKWNFRKPRLFSVINKGKK